MNRLESQIHIDRWQNVIQDKVSKQNADTHKELDEIKETMETPPIPFQWIQWYAELHALFLHKRSPSFDIPENEKEFLALDAVCRFNITSEVQEVVSLIEEARAYGIAVELPESKEAFGAWFMHDEKSPEHFARHPHMNNVWNRVMIREVYLLQQAGLPSLSPEQLSFLSQNIPTLIGLGFDTDFTISTQKDFLSSLFKQKHISTYEEAIALIKSPAFQIHYENVLVEPSKQDVLLRDFLNEEICQEPSIASQEIFQVISSYIPEDSTLVKPMLKQLYTSYYSPRISLEQWNNVQHIIDQESKTIKFHDINFLLWASEFPELMQLYDNPEALESQMQIFDTIPPSVKSQGQPEKWDDKIRNKEKLIMIHDAHASFFEKMREMHDEYVNGDYTDKALFRTYQKEKMKFLRRNPKFKREREALFYSCLNLSAIERDRQKEYIDEKKASREFIYNYCERPTVRALSRIKQLEITSLRNALNSPETKANIGSLLWKDIYVYDNSEIGGHIQLKMEKGQTVLHLRSSYSVEINNFDDGYIIEKKNDLLTPLAHFSFHFHALDIDNSSYSGPSWSMSSDGTFDAADLGFIGLEKSDVVMTTMGHPIDELGNSIKNEIQVNLDMYWKNKDTGKVQIFDLGIITVPFEKQSK
jgi:hypothetical protein